MKKTTEEKDGQQVEEYRLRGYKMMPVFRIENTGGEDLLVRYSIPAAAIL